MQVQLKQSELVSAVRQFLTKQGISLDGKDVDVKFSATRGDAGIVAMIDIDDIDLPALTPNERPSLEVVRPIAVKATDLDLGKTSVASVETTVDANPAGEASLPAGEKKTTSLFGN